MTKLITLALALAAFGCSALHDADQYSTGDGGSGANGATAGATSGGGSGGISSGGSAGTSACGGADAPCCNGACNSAQNVCVDGFCRHCGDVGERCCAGNTCNGADWQDWRICSGDICKNCCAVCQGEGATPLENGHPVNVKDEGGDCALAAQNYCENLKNCPGPSCCAQGCVNIPGDWSTCL
jgi:hypothetical protein